MLQEGHTRETYGIDFQHDGALVATGDLGGVGRVWDLRSGKSIHLMQASCRASGLFAFDCTRTSFVNSCTWVQGHVKGITTVAFAPTGFIVATGGYDHTVRA